MARLITSKTNTNPASGGYPFGRIRNASSFGAGDGTPVDEALLGDAMQYFDKLLDEGSVTANGLPENNSDGFQYIEALQNIIDSRATDIRDEEAFIYSAVLTQTSTNAPVPTKGKDNFSLTWSRSTTGVYFADMGSITANPNFITIGTPRNVNHVFLAGIGPLGGHGTSQDIVILTYNSGTLTDGLLSGTSFEYRRYKQTV